MTSPPRLAAPLEAYRIGDPLGRWPVYSPEGARAVSGRWHERGDRVIYASEHYSTAMLEMLARWNGPPPGDQHFIRIEIPEGTTYEVIEPRGLPDWHIPGSPAAREAGHGWYARGVRIPTKPTTDSDKPTGDSDPCRSLWRSGGP